MCFRLFLIITLSMIAILTTGCRGMVEFMHRSYERKEHRADERREYREIEQQARLQTREAEQEIQQVLAVADAACADQQRQALQGQMQDSIHSRLGLDVKQQLKVGQLQINEEQLKKMLEQREKLFAERQKLVDELNKEADAEYEAAVRENLRSQLRSQLNHPTCQMEELNAEPSCCCKCDSCCVSACEECTKCARGKHRRKRSCEVRERLVELPRQPVRQNVREPLLATEIPLMLPVTLELNMNNPRVQETQVRREPLRELREPLRHNPSCCPAPCDYPACDYPPSNKPANVGNNSGTMRVSPPKPPVDVAQRQSMHRPAQIPAHSSLQRLPSPDPTATPATPQGNSSQESPQNTSSQVDQTTYYDRYLPESNEVIRIRK